MHKKAQGLSLNTVVIAAIVLIVLVILVAIVMGAISNFSEDFETIRETSCPSAKDECDSDEKKILGNFQPRLPPGKVCCVYTCGHDPSDSCKNSCLPSERGVERGHTYCKQIDASKPVCCRSN